MYAKRPKALLTARLGTQCQDIARSVAGAIFLGCPFGGTECAAVIDSFTTFLRNRQEILSSLKRNSSKLFELQHDFRTAYPDLPMACFYEQLKSAPSNSLVLQRCINELCTFTDGF